MPLRIAFDLDGTIADMNTSLRREAAAIFRRDAPARLAAAPTSPEGQTNASPGDHVGEPAPDADDLRLSARQQMRLWDHVKKIENFWTTLAEVEPGIVKRLATTAAERRWEVIFLTTRPSTAGDITQVQSQRWLAKHGFRHPSVFVVQPNRGKIADAMQLDAVVDDRPENCLDIVLESKAKAILVWPRDASEVPAGASRMGVRVVPSISEALNLLERYDDERKQPGMVRSIRKLLGRQTVS
ncbi:MAG: hypothetical protein ACRD2N_19225 [Vicinamibacterales bacterium]